MGICRVFERPDGSVIVFHPAPQGRRAGDTEARWLARACARAVEAQPDLAGLPFRDLDPATLPPRTASCADGCGEEHPVRNQWRMAGAGQDRRPAVDPVVRNVYAELRHLERAAERAATQTDGGKLALIAQARVALVRSTRDGSEPPEKATIDHLIADTPRRDER